MQIQLLLVITYYQKFMEWIGHFGEIQNMKGFWK